MMAFQTIITPLCSFRARCSSPVIWDVSGSKNVYKVFGIGLCTRACQRHNNSPLFKLMVSYLNNSGMATKQHFTLKMCNGVGHIVNHTKSQIGPQIIYPSCSRMLRTLFQDTSILKLQIITVKYSFSLC